MSLLATAVRRLGVTVLDAHCREARVSDDMELVILLLAPFPMTAPETQK